MKSIFFLSAIFLFSFGASAQSQWYYYAEEFYFVKEVPVKEWRGKNFRYEIAVKANPADTLSKVRIHCINVGKGKEDFIHTDFTIETRLEQDWQIYTLAGKVDDNAWKTWFYTAVNGNGEYYFDDISFYIEVEPGQWKQVILPNTSFESRSSNIFEGYYVSMRNSKNLTTRLSNTVYKTGSKALYVNSRKQLPVSMLTSSK